MQRQERLDALLLKFGADFLFVTRPSMNRKPAGFLLRGPVALREIIVMGTLNLVQTWLRHIQSHSIFQVFLAGPAGMKVRPFSTADRTRAEEPEMCAC